MAEQHGTIHDYSHAGAGSNPAALSIYTNKNLRTMTDKDRKLVEEAESLYRAIDWEYANRLLEHAESAEARRRIERVVKSLYHKEHD